jgi:PAS domain S-box-containing protein
MHELTDLSPVSTIILDQNGCILYANDAFCKFSGYPAADLLNADFNRILIFEDGSGISATRFSQRLAALLKTRTEECTLRTRSNIHKRAKISLHQIDGPGNEIRYAGYIEDQTKLQQEIELREHLERRFRIFEENDLVGFGLFKNAQVIYANSTLLKFFGLHGPLDKNLRNTELLFNYATQATKQDILARRNLEKENGSIIIEEPFVGEFIGRNQQTKYLEIHSKEIFLSGEKGRLIFALDITEKKRSEKELVEANQKLEQSLADLKAMSKVREDFLSIVSHEIRTPLNSVVGLSNLLLRRTPREDQLAIIKTLKHSGDNLLYLVNDILDYSKIQAGKLELEYTECNVAECMNHLQVSFAETARQQGLEYNVIVDPDIPARIMADVTRLNQVFNNLIGNAIKFTSHGYVEFRAALKSEQSDTCTITFTVKDTGIGIHPDKLSHIFEPFQQSEADISRKYGGTGLGLSIVKALVELLKGEIRVESDPGKGTTFYVTLSFTLYDDLNVTQHVSAVPIPPVHSLSILYVEDVESNRFLVQQLLLDHGIECTLAFSGKEALLLTATRNFDLILMDIQMPNMDGYETTDRIRAQENGKNKLTPIIAFTAEPFSDKIKTRLLNHQISDVITKPFDLDQFIEKITRTPYLKNIHPTPHLYSLEFYETILNSNAEKLNEIRELIINDLSLFKVNLQLAFGARNLNNLTEELHRIRPIVKNLNARVLLDLFEQVNRYTMHERQMEELVDEISHAVDNLVSELSESHYSTR